MTQTDLFQQTPNLWAAYDLRSNAQDTYWNADETKRQHIRISGSALREFYSTSGDERINAYSQFVKSCDVFAHLSGISFLEAARQIHTIYDINTGKQ